MSATSVLGMRAGLDQEQQQDPAPGVRDAAGLPAWFWGPGPSPSEQAPSQSLKHCAAPCLHQIAPLPHQ